MGVVVVMGDMVGTWLWRGGFGCEERLIERMRSYRGSVAWEEWRFGWYVVVRTGWLRRD
jgi:hypothetical protein